MKPKQSESTAGDEQLPSPAYFCLLWGECCPSSARHLHIKRCRVAVLFEHASEGVRCTGTCMYRKALPSARCKHAICWSFVAINGACLPWVTKQAPVQITTTQRWLCWIGRIEPCELNPCWKFHSLLISWSGCFVIPIARIHVPRLGFREPTWKTLVWRNKKGQSRLCVYF